MSRRILMTSCAAAAFFDVLTEREPDYAGWYGAVDAGFQP